MTKIKLKMLSNFGEVLTREELKKVSGGFGFGSGLGFGFGSGFGSGRGGKCFTNDTPETACANKPDRDICSYCILQGTDFERTQTGTCKTYTTMGGIIKKYCS
ncbi:hypothetical protein KZO53_06225 [Prevotella melaninogenica]|jgi:hypothetical protein|uniref:hypothetical protein n=1 Tax=Prevotella melaninogenica TaxID=28132 RepID=UPI001C5FD565|nr:hypothetical protein [Prevotella melaninogenica]MBW4762091.1 hypothetical protein [Prevotella melaninogenica]